MHQIDPKQHTFFQKHIFQTYPTLNSSFKLSDASSIKKLQNFHWEYKQDYSSIDVKFISLPLKQRILKNHSIVEKN